MGPDWGLAPLTLVVFLLVFGFLFSRLVSPKRGSPRGIPKLMIGIMSTLLVVPLFFWVGQKVFSLWIDGPALVVLGIALLFLGWVVSSRTR